MGLPEHGGDGYIVDSSICMPESVRAMPVTDGVWLDIVKWQQILKASEYYEELAAVIHILLYKT
jgi:hypothetical protein